MFFCFTSLVLLSSSASSEEIETLAGTYNYTLPGGTGVATDYRIFTVPLFMTGVDMLNTLETVLGTYDPYFMARVRVSER